MGRLTYSDRDGNWGLRGLELRELVRMPPSVYRALLKLKDTEELIDRLYGEDDEDCLDALRKLKAMGSNTIGMEHEMDRHVNTRTGFGYIETGGRP